MYTRIVLACIVSFNGVGSNETGDTERAPTELQAEAAGSNKTGDKGRAQAGLQMDGGANKFGTQKPGMKTVTIKAGDEDKTTQKKTGITIILFINMDFVIDDDGEIRPHGSSQT